MAIDATTPRTRRTLILGGLGGLLATIGGHLKAPTVRAGVDGDVVLDDVNTGAGTTELQSTASPAFKVLGSGTAISAGGTIGVDAGGTSIAVNGVTPIDSTGVGVVGWSRGFKTGVIGFTTNGAGTSPTAAAKTGVQGVSDADDAFAVGVLGHATTGIGVNGISTGGMGVRGDTTNGIGAAGMGPSGIDPWTGAHAGVFGSAADDPGVLGYSTNGPGVRGDGTTGDGVYGRVDDQASADTHPAHTSGAGVHGSGGKRGVAGVIGSHGMTLMTTLPDPIDPHTGVYGISDTGHGVYGASDTGIGVYAANNSATKGAIVAEGGPGTAIHGHANVGPVPASPALTGLYGSATSTGVAIAADATSGVAIRATSSASHGIRGRGQLDGVIGESPGARSGVVGFSGAGSAPAGPARTGVYGLATQDATARGVHGESTTGQGVHGEATTGVGVAAVATSGSALTADAAGGHAIRATSSASHGIRGRGQLDGVIGESPGGRSGIVGYSGAGTAPAGPGKTGVYGEATQDTASRGVTGFSLVGQGVRGEATTGQGVQGIATSGQAVRGDATSGIAVRAVATTGYALFASGKVKTDRSGVAVVPANQTYVDVTVVGGVAATSLGFANLQIRVTGVYVAAVRPAYPTASQMRIYLNKVASTTATTPVAWMVLS